jgi:ABC-2 type transport system permease protein
MKKFRTVFDFELKNYLKNKMFIWVTVILVLVEIGAVAVPVIKNAAKKQSSGTKDIKTIYMCDLVSSDNAAAAKVFQNALGSQYKVKAVTMDAKQAKKYVSAGKCDGALLITAPDSYEYFVTNIGLRSAETDVFDQLMTESYRASLMQSYGMDTAQVNKVLRASVTGKVTATGKDQTQTFMYSYMVLMLLYMALLMYGQLVAQSVANEKSTRAMEVLITSASPTQLMFGKVLGSGTAGLLQLIVISGSGAGAYALFKDKINSSMIDSLFNIPVSILLYTVLFFILGFFIYAFLYGAFASLASRAEDLNILTMPVTFIFIAAFMIVIVKINTGDVDDALMIFCSYFPLTSPIAMFERIAMGNPKHWEILVSVVLQVLTVVLFGKAAAKIYSHGVLMYGNSPKVSDVFRILFTRDKRRS